MSVWKRFDAQDVLLVLGLMLFLGGIAYYSRPLAAISGGLLCFGAVWTMEKAAVAVGKVKGADGSTRK